MILKIVQLGIVMSVVFADIYFEWGAPGYAAPAMGVFLAYVLTVLPLVVIDWAKGRHVRSEKHL